MGDSGDGPDSSSSGRQAAVAYKPGEEKVAADRLVDLFKNPERTFAGLGAPTSAAGLADEFASNHEFGENLAGLRQGWRCPRGLGWCKGCLEVAPRPWFLAWGPGGAVWAVVGCAVSVLVNFPLGNYQHFCHEPERGIGVLRLY